jgi:hypothetical protein
LNLNYMLILLRLEAVSNTRVGEGKIEREVMIDSEECETIGIPCHKILKRDLIKASLLTAIIVFYVQGSKKNP